MPHENDVRAMRTLMSAFGPLPQTQWEQLASDIRTETLAKGQHFLRAGSRATTVGYVAEGLLRLYYHGGDGKEFNKSFVFAPDLVSGHESLISGAPSRLSIEALEPTRLLVVPYATLSRLYEEDIAWQRLGRVFTELLYVKKARKEAALLMDSATDRYQAYLDEYGALEGRVADYHVASYLGITPEALSRLKRGAR